MAQPARQAKVLRIGIIKDRNLVQERLIKQGETVTIGESANNTFVFPASVLPQKEYALFVYGKKGYVLNFTQAMKGKISSGGAVVALDKLRNDPSVERAEDQWRLPLTEQDRGKIGIDDNVTVLFQFVPPPPQQAVKAIQQMDFRPRLLEDDDPIFLGFLAIFTALAAVLLVWVWNTDPPKTRSLDEIPDRFTKLILHKDEPKPDLEIKTDKTDQSPTKAEKAEPKPEPGGDKSQEPKGEREKAKAEKAAEEQVLEQSLLLRYLTTRGENKDGHTAADLWSDSDDGISDLDAAVKGVGGVKIATSEDEHQLRGGGKGGTEDVDIGDLKGATGGSTDGVGGGPAVEVKGSVNLDAIDPSQTGGDYEQVAGIVKTNMGQLTYCYEQQLKSDPKLAGRVEVEFTVSHGRVSSAYVLANTTRNTALGECIVSKVTRWRGFPAEMSDTVVYPFVFKPSN